MFYEPNKFTIGVLTHLDLFYLSVIMVNSTGNLNFLFTSNSKLPTALFEDKLSDLPTPCIFYF